MGMLAGELLRLELPQSNKRLFVFVETDGCFADGVSVASGCTLGHRTLRLMDYGKVAATFVDTETETSLRIWPHPGARTRALDYMPDAKTHWHAQLDAYQIMPYDELYRWQPVKLTVPLKQIISRPGIRVSCAHCGEEILNGREVVIDGETLCLSCSGEHYFQAAVTV